MTTYAFDGSFRSEVQMSGRDTTAKMKAPAVPAEGPRVVLLVDDEAANLEHLAVFFERRGFAVRAFTSAHDAVGAVEGGLRPALVVTDFRMPDMDGIAFVDALRRIMPDVKSIMLTAHGSVDTYIRSFSLGVFEYVNKPVDENELDRVVRSALKQAARS
jgi:DNA-binding NtrC family response regulator